MSRPEFLDAAEVETLLPDPGTARDLVRDCLVGYARGEVENPAKIGVHPPGTRHVHAMPAYVPSSDGGIVGQKWLTHLTHPTPGHAAINAVVLLNDPRTGTVRITMDATALTGLRTAAVSQVAVDALSGPGPVAIVGTGVQARTHLASLLATRPDLDDIVVVGRSRESADAVCHDGPARPTTDLEKSVRTAATVITVTSGTTSPLISASWLAPGATWIDLDEPAKDLAAIAKADLLVPDSWEQSTLKSWDNDLARAGLPMPPPLLGDIAADDDVPARSAETDRVVVAPSGLGACDLVIAHEVWLRSRRER